jgi:2'-5' RNA ligase
VPSLRAFVALDIRPEDIERVAAIARRLRESPLCPAPRASWTAASKMHVTLKFLGQLDTTAVAPLGDALRPLAAKTPPLALRAARLGAFPSPTRATVIVVELDEPTGSLARLAQHTESIAEPFGVPRESRPYRPHLTLARIRAPTNAQTWLASEPATSVGTCTATDLVLYESAVTPQGATYTPLMREELGGAGGENPPLG